MSFVFLIMTSTKQVMFLALSVGWFELCVCIHYYYYYFFFLFTCLSGFIVGLFALFSSLLGQI